MKFKKNVSLKKHNTFGLDVNAELFASIKRKKHLLKLKEIPKPTLILGGGSNLLLTQDVEGLVLKVNIKGREIIDEDEDSVHVKFWAGENWHKCVMWSIKNGYGGIENLSLIPGKVGAAPMQNIGAYGVELKDVFVELEAFNLETRTFRTFNNTECQFGYRDSIFKKDLKDKVIILSITLRLTKIHQLNTSYGAISNTLDEMGIHEPTIKNISDAVIQIRNSKLPDPKKIGNSGSFFKNPEIPVSQLTELKEKFPNIVYYKLPNEMVKVPAGWLIEQCGWKGKRVGNTGAYEKQALVLINYGGATGTEVKDLAFEIKNSVKTKFGIELVPEVNII